MPHIGYISISPLLIESRLKREYGSHAIDIFLNLLNSTRAPRPHLGRDVIEDFYTSRTSNLRETHIKIRIIYQNENIRPPLFDQAGHRRERGEDLSSRTQNVTEPHRRARSITINEKLHPCCGTLGAGHPANLNVRNASTQYGNDPGEVSIT
jgi:hypothetical protein